MQKPHRVSIEYFPIFDRVFFFLPSDHTLGTYFAALKSVDQSCFVDDGAACNVDDHNTLLHLVKLRSANHVVGGGCEGCADHNDIRLAEEGIVGCKVGIVFRFD